MVNIIIPVTELIIAAETIPIPLPGESSDPVGVGMKTLEVVVEIGDDVLDIIAFDVLITTEV